MINQYSSLIPTIPWIVEQVKLISNYVRKRFKSRLESSIEDRILIISIIAGFVLIYRYVNGPIIRITL